MGSSRIEQMIDEIYEFVESCKPVPLSSTKVVVPKDELFDLIDELKLRTPDEIKRYQKIIANRDSIIADAEEKANNLIADAKAETDRMINESDIMQDAVKRADELLRDAEDKANRIVMEANEDAAQIHAGALSYAEDLLIEVEKVVRHAYESSKSRYDGFFDTLRGNLEILTSNRNEITAELHGDNVQSNGNDANIDTVEAGSAEDVDFDFEEDTFLEGVEDIDE